MSDPTRYSIVIDFQPPWSKMHEFRSGEWVKWDDYAHLHSQFANSEQENASLQAEVERLRKEVESADRESMSDEYHLNNQTRIINGLLTDKEQMQAKIDRLIKAGNLLAFHYVSLGRKFFTDDPLPSSVTDWNAAKEGNPTK